MTSPSDKEWQILEKHLGMKEWAYSAIYDFEIAELKGEADRESGEIGHILKSRKGWDKTSIGNDSLKFSIVPAGRCWDGKTFQSLGKIGEFWTSTKGNEYTAWTRTFHTRKGIIRLKTIYRDPKETENKESIPAISVRCVKN